MQLQWNCSLEVAIKSLKLPKKRSYSTSESFFLPRLALLIRDMLIFVDVNLSTQNISVQDIEKKITKRTKAIVCTFGSTPCDVCY